MKKLFALVALMAVTLSVQAQHEEGDVTIQPRVGITVSNITNLENNKSKINLTYGVDFERFFTDQFSVSLGVMFTNQGCKFEDIIMDAHSGSQNSNVHSNKYKFNIYYGTLPIMANYYVFPGLALKAGIQPGFRVKANIDYDGTKVDFDNTVDALFEGSNNKLNTFDLSIPVGLSYELAGVTLDARYNFGVTKLISNTNKTVRNSVFMVTLGYKF